MLGQILYPKAGQLPYSLLPYLSADCLDEGNAPGFNELNAAATGASPKPE